MVLLYGIASDEISILPRPISLKGCYSSCGTFKACRTTTVISRATCVLYMFTACTYDKEVTEATQQLPLLRCQCHCCLQMGQEIAWLWVRFTGHREIQMLCHCLRRFYPFLQRPFYLREILICLMLLGMSYAQWRTITLSFISFFSS